MINERIPILEFFISLELKSYRFASLTGAEVDQKLTKRNFIKNERFAEESGAGLQWSLFDRRDIPPRSDGIPINSRTMSQTKFFKNPEIVGNIHLFKPPSHRETQPKRKRGDPEDDNVEDDGDVLPLLKNFTGDDEFSH